jgi:hypothetical protein
MVPLARVDRFAFGVHCGGDNHLHDSSVCNDGLWGKSGSCHFLDDSFECGVSYLRKQNFPDDGQQPFIQGMPPPLYRGRLYGSAAPHW